MQFNMQNCYYSYDGKFSLRESWRWKLVGSLNIELIAKKLSRTCEKLGVVLFGVISWELPGVTRGNHE